jgi:UDP-N-acetylmuramoyl-L-alanyl-D-glutamate--2,6-diaminopimelate ligase
MADSLDWFMSEMMKAETMIAGLPISMPTKFGVEVLGVAHDSRRISRGDLYIAIRGEHFDGSEFVEDALERGAVAVLSAEQPDETSEVPWLLCSDPRSVMGHLAARVYDHPDREVVLAGVTGTNGKSTVAILMAQILSAAGLRSGEIGTLGYRFEQTRYEGDRTTPESTDLFRIMRQMRQAGAGAISMEVSSHALAQGRVLGAEYDVAIFTNLTRDHFDFHRDFDNYFETKSRLFEQLKPTGRAAINVDDPYGRRLAATKPEALTFGLQGEVKVVKSKFGLLGIKATIETPRGSLEIASPLVGGYNLENLVAAIAGAEALRISQDAIVEGVGSCGPITGRMEAVDCGQAFPVFIDFAHTDAALTAALQSLRQLHTGKQIVVFGCGGEKDVGKRELMGQAAGELADIPILTNDNPRNEDPLAIIASVEEGLKRSGNQRYMVVPDRSEAIRRAIAVAAGQHAILVAGKGHEETQELGDATISFSDRKVVKAALEEYLD